MLPDEVDQSYLKNQVVIVGYGEVGRRIARALQAQQVKVVIAEENREIVESLRNKGIAAVSGNATEPAVLIQAHIMHASMLVISPRDLLQVRHMAEIARQLNPDIEIMLCAESTEEARMLALEDIGRVYYAKNEMATNMTHHIMLQMGFEARHHDDDLNNTNLAKSSH